MHGNGSVQRRAASGGFQSQQVVFALELLVGERSRESAANGSCHGHFDGGRFPWRVDRWCRRWVGWLEARSVPTHGRGDTTTCRGGVVAMVLRCEFSFLTTTC